MSAARPLPPPPDWLRGIRVKLTPDGLMMHCRECGSVLCTIEVGDSFWALTDVARDHRQSCRDSGET